jgi:hypothetical protein
MVEIKLLSLFIGSLGLQAMFASGWLRWQQVVVERQREAEEETLTPYESRETYSSAEAQPMGYEMPSKDPRLAGWEFKIVRANQDLFRDPRVLKQLCDEESQAGWILLEKLDDRRIRFKRPIALREIIKPEFLPHDPYRTHFGPTSDWTKVLVALSFLVALILPAYLGFALVSVTLSNSRSQSTTPSGASPSPTPPAPSPSQPQSTPTPSP